MRDRIRIPVAFAALIVWLLITVWGVWNPHDPATLTDGVASGPAWSIIGAGAFLLALVLVMGWKDMGFNAPRPWSSLRLFWFPLLYIGLFFAGSLFIGLPPQNVILFLAINTLAVGFSEELMFRGVLFRALQTRLPIWPAIWLTSVIFGSVHVINALTTGDLLSASVQAVTAFMSGVFFLAMVLRTGSILPSMLFHACWDFLLTMTAAGGAIRADETAAGEPSSISMTMLLPLLLILPNFIYGLFLLRKVGRPVAPQPMASSTAISS